MGRPEEEGILRVHAVVLALRQRGAPGLPRDVPVDTPRAARKTDANPLLYTTTLEAGHGGKSGRFQRFREIAEEYAFILDQSGVRE